eukprot:ctg_528.g252
MEYPLGDRLPPPEPLEAVLPLGAPPGVCGDVDYELTSSDYYFSSYSHFQPAPFPGQGGAGRRLRHGDPVAVCCAGRRRQSVRCGVQPHHRAGAGDRATEPLRARYRAVRVSSGGAAAADRPAERPGDAGGRDRLRVDGLLPLLRVHAGVGAVCAGQVVAAGHRAHVPGPGDAVPVCHRGRRLPPRQDRLLGLGVRVRLFVHQAHRAHRAAGGLCGCRAGEYYRVPDSAGGCGAGYARRAGLVGALSPDRHPQRLCARPGGLLRHRLHALPPPAGLQYRTGGQVEPLEADGVLSGSGADHERGRGDRGHAGLPPQRQQPARLGYRSIVPLSGQKDECAQHVALPTAIAR